MRIILQRRAEIALRSLDKAEQNKITRSLSELSFTDQERLRSNQKIKKLASGVSGKILFIYKGSKKLKLILLFEGDTCIVEDIIEHDRLNRLMGKRGQ